MQRQRVGHYTSAGERLIERVWCSSKRNWRKDRERDVASHRGVYRCRGSVERAIKLERRVVGRTLDCTTRCLVNTRSLI